MATTLEERSLPLMVEPSAYLKHWWDDQRPRCRVDLSDVNEAWLDALKPTVTPLYGGDELNAAFMASEARALHAEARVVGLQAAPFAKGWKLVPVEPTTEMLRCANISRGAYRAMIVAAPQP